MIVLRGDVMVAASHLNGPINEIPFSRSRKETAEKRRNVYVESVRSSLQSEPRPSSGYIQLTAQQIFAAETYRSYGKDRKE